MEFNNVTEEMEARNPAEQTKKKVKTRRRENVRARLPLTFGLYISSQERRDHSSFDAANAKPITVPLFIGVSLSRWEVSNSFTSVFGLGPLPCDRRGTFQWLVPRRLRFVATMSLPCNRTWTRPICFPPDFYCVLAGISLAALNIANLNNNWGHIIARMIQRWKAISIQKERA